MVMMHLIWNRAMRAIIRVGGGLALIQVLLAMTQVAAVPALPVAACTADLTTAAAILATLHIMALLMHAVV